MAIVLHCLVFVVLVPPSLFLIACWRCVLKGPSNRTPLFFSFFNSFFLFVFAWCPAVDEGYIVKWSSLTDTNGQTLGYLLWERLNIMVDQFNEVNQMLAHNRK